MDPVTERGPHDDPEAPPGAPDEPARGDALDAVKALLEENADASSEAEGT